MTEPAPPGDDGGGHRSGIVALVGRPNVGKSTLLNHLVGAKVAIVTQVPGTTRNAIRGVVTRHDAQIVFLDTPGLARPRTLLGRRQAELVRGLWSSVDAVCLVVDVAAGVGHGDAYLARQLPAAGPPLLAVANKEDVVKDKLALLPQLERLAQLADFTEVIPVSAVTGTNLRQLLDLLVGHLPHGPRLFPDGELTDQPERVLVAELVREKLSAGMQHELPHSIAVVVEDMRASEDRDDVVDVDVSVLVERDSQKAIVIGKGGSTLKEAGTRARHEIEALLGSRVFLTTHVRVAKDWQRDPKQLHRFGY